MKFSTLRAARRAPLLQIAKTVIGIVVSWYACVFLLDEEFPVFAAMATLLVIAPSVNQSFTKGIERSLGVVLGVVIAMLATLVFGTASWVGILAMMIGLGIAWALRVAPGIANEVAISALLVIALGGGTAEFSFIRIFETVIGAAVAIIVNALIVPPVRTEAAREKLEQLGTEIGDSMIRLADALDTPQAPGQLQGLMIEARLMRPMQEAAQRAIRNGFEALMLNPRSAKHRAVLNEMDALLNEKLEPMVSQVLGMTRAFFDHYEPSLAEEPAAHDIADQLRRSAHDVRLAAQEAEVNLDPMTSAIPALTAPLQLRPPTGGNWVLIGSLMEDLRRIREALVFKD